MLLEIKKTNSTEYIEVDRVEHTEDKVYYDRDKINSSFDKSECSMINLYLNDLHIKMLHYKGE